MIHICATCSNLGFSCFSPSCLLKNNEKVSWVDSCSDWSYTIKTSPIECH